MASAHPMLMPLAPREAAKHLPDEGSRELFLLLHDLLEAICAGAPVWKLERRLVWVGNVHFALETASLVEKGWRGGRFGDRSIGRVTGSEALPPDTVYRAIAIEEAELPPHPPLTLSDVLREMAKVGLGRPSTYVDALKDLVKYRNFDEDEGCLSGDAKVLLERLRKNPETRAYLLEFSQRMRSCLEEIAEGRRTSRDVLQVLLPTLHEKVGEDIDALQIDDTPAMLTYLERDQASLGQEAIFWRGTGLAKEIDPEVTIGADSPLRTQRSELDLKAREREGDKRWGAMSAAERRDARIALLAKSEGISVSGWMVTHQFDVLARWMVGWPLGEF